MKYLYFLPWLIFLNLSLVCYGQKSYFRGYIITNNNDTIHGLIYLKSNYQNSRSCDFMGEKDQNPENFSPLDIKAYRIENNKYYISKEITVDSVKQRVFLEYLVDGIIDLYYLKDMVDEYYFIEKDSLLMPLSNKEITVFQQGDNIRENDKEYSRNSNQYKGILRYLFQESPGTINKISNTPFEYKSLIKITKDYHNSICNDYECIDYTRSSKRNIYIEPSIGIINTWMELKTSKDHAYNIKPSFGLQLRFKPLKSFTSWNFLLGLNYSANDLRGNFDNNLYYYSSTKTYQIYTKYSILRIPLTIDYTFPKAKLQPFLSVSYVNVILLNSKIAAYKVYNDALWPESAYLRKYQYGFSLGLGLKYNLKNDNYIFIKNEFEYRIPSANLHYVLDYIKCKSWLINFGYGFSI